MKTRRSFLLSLTAGAVALAVLVVPAIADELMGRITKVDVDASKVTVVEKGSDKDVEVTVNDDTVFVNAKGEEGKVNLKKMAKNLEKAKKGIRVVVTHDKGVASRIKVEAKKKDNP